MDLCAQTTLYMRERPVLPGEIILTLLTIHAEKGVSFQTDGRGSYSLTLHMEPMSAGSHLS